MKIWEFHEALICFEKMHDYIKYEYLGGCYASLFFQRQDQPSRFLKSQCTGDQHPNYYT